MLVNLTDIQIQALDNLLNLAVHTLGQKSINVLLNIVVPGITPASDETLKELGYEKVATPES